MLPNAHSSYNGENRGMLCNVHGLWCNEKLESKLSCSQTIWKHLKRKTKQNERRKIVKTLPFAVSRWKLNGICLYDTEFIRSTKNSFGIQNAYEMTKIPYFVSYILNCSSHFAFKIRISKIISNSKSLHERISKNKWFQRTRKGKEN